MNYRELHRLYELDGPQATVEHVGAALQAGELQPADFSLRELAEAVVPDGREWVRSLDPRGALIRENGVLSGYGTLTGNVASDGTLRVGGAADAPATSMVIDGNVQLGAKSVVDVDLQGLLAGVQYDRLAIDGSAALGGALKLSLSGFAPKIGDTFQILSAAHGLTGQFDMTETQLPLLTSDLGWLVSYSANNVTLHVTTRNVGDFSANGSVGAEDLEVWAANYGSTTNLSADADRSGVVDGGDFLLWQRNVGGVVTYPAGATVPEPATTALIVAGALTVLVERRGKSRKCVCS